MPQPLAYHDFADKREAYRIENFLDVGSNLAFALAGGVGLLLVLRPRTCFASPAERWPYLVFCIGVLLTAAGSCYHHLEPNNETLFWDRLPMTIAFMGLISAQIVDRINVRAGPLALVPMLLIGVGTVVCWIVTERQGRGNVIPYVVLQAYAAIVLLKLAAMHPSRYTHGNAIYAVFAGYGCWPCRPARGVHVVASPAASACRLGGRRGMWIGPTGRLGAAAARADWAPGGSRRTFRSRPAQGVCLAGKRATGRHPSIPCGAD